MHLEEVKQILITLLPAAAGSALSAFDSKHTISNKVFTVIEFIFGFLVAMYVGYAFVNWLGIKNGSPESYGIVFVVGYIGLNILRESRTKVGAALDLLITRFFGGQK